MSAVPLAKVALGIEAADFLQELDALLQKHSARLVVQRTAREHALQVRFAESAGLALTLARDRVGRGCITYAGDGFASL